MIREDHWPGTGSGCEDVIGDRLLLGCLAGVVTAMVPVGPALVYSMLARRGEQEL
jgi:hypothetical protein